MSEKCVWCQDTGMETFKTVSGKIAHHPCREGCSTEVKEFKIDLTLGGKLYNAVNNMLAHLGAEGEIEADHRLVGRVMSVLAEMDGGVYHKVEL